MKYNIVLTPGTIWKWKNYGDVWLTLGSSEERLFLVQFVGTRSPFMTTRGRLYVQTNEKDLVIVSE